jgi:outer membrane protein OmpA-like peptidoglycan-associated protein
MCIVFRLVFASLLGLTLSACSSIHNTIGPETPHSELRESLQAPLSVSESGSPFCQETTVVAVTPKVVRLPESYHATLYFDLDKTSFTPASLRDSIDVYKAILERKNRRVEIVGHTDTLGADAYNEKLSVRRADKVAQDLINAGVKPNQISVSGKGETSLKVPTDNGTEEARNRRVEIDVR